MIDIANLLEEKNQHLEKFYEMNQSELNKFNAGDFDGLEDFYSKREGLLAVIRKIDDMIEDSNEQVYPQDVTAEDKKRILKALSYKNEIVTLILAQDLQVLSIIEQEKSDIIKDLSQVRSARKALNGYRSGDSVNRLNEEA